MHSNLDKTNKNLSKLDTINEGLELMASRFYTAMYDFEDVLIDATEKIFNMIPKGRKRKLEFSIGSINYPCPVQFKEDYDYVYLEVDKIGKDANGELYVSAFEHKCKFTDLTALEMYNIYRAIIDRYFNDADDEEN